MGNVTYYKALDVHVAAVPAERFAIRLVDKPKRECGENRANGGFFANFTEQGERFTLPVGHLVCDYGAANKWTRYYCQQRGRFDGEKFTFDCSRWQHNNPFYCKAMSTLVVQDGAAKIQDLASLPACDYAIAGVPVMRDGGDVKFATYVRGQGWDGSTLYATWHTFVGLKDDPGTIYVMGMKTTSANMILSAEAYRKFKALGFRDVIKLDGGGSFWFSAGGRAAATEGDRRICTEIVFDREPVEKKEGTEKKMFKIALGAGHGIGTPGKRCLKALDPNETREWQLNDRVCDYVEQYLADYDGYELLRLDDSDDGAEDVALADRVKSANSWGADFYLSIHHNAGINGGSGGGIVAYTHPQSSKESVEWRDELYEALIEKTGLRGNRAAPKATSNLYVLRETKMPAVLLELGFMDSAADVPVILTDEYARGCALAIVEVVVRRGGLTKKAQTDKPASWAENAWNRAVKAGVLDGTRPRDNLTRQELAAVLAKLGLV